MLVLPLVGWLHAAAVAGPSSDSIRPTILDVQPLRTRFGDVAKSLGATPLARLGPERGPSILVVCYRSGEEPGEVFLPIESGSNGGYGDIVSGFALTSREPENLTPEIQSAEGSGRHASKELCTRTIW